MDNRPEPLDWAFASARPRRAAGLELCDDEHIRVAAGVQLQQKPLYLAGVIGPKSPKVIRIALQMAQR